MKNLFGFLSLMLVLMVLCTSCGHFSDGTSLWAGQLWLAPWISGPASIYSFYRAYKSSKSNSTQQLPGRGGTLDNQGNVAITRLFSFWAGVVLGLFCIGFIIGVNIFK